MAKAPLETVHLVSSAGTGYTYAVRRNKKKSRGVKKLSVRKYDPIAQAHVEFNEKKLSSLKKKFNLETFNAAKQTKSDEGASA
jgi:large subunit ribosomal protein L33